MSRVAIVGGGISGLAAAYFLKKQKHAVTVFEASERLGGAIQTVKVGQELMEAGPDSFVVSKPNAINLAKELGIELVESCSVGPPSVVKQGRLLPLPDGFRLLAPTRLIPFALTGLMSFRGKLRAGAEVFIGRRSGNDDESVGDFVIRRFGKELLDSLAQPLIGGIYSADPCELSLQATFPFLSSMEKHHGSVTKGMLKSIRKMPSGSSKSMFSAPKKGMSSLVDGLADAIGSEEIRLSQSVKGLHQERGKWVLELEQNQGRYDGVVLACPAHRAAGLLSGLDQSLADGLNSIPYTTTAVCHLVVKRQQIRRPLEGSGFVVPHVEGLDITACTYSHLKYPGRASKEVGLLRVHLGGRLNQNVIERSDRELLEIAVKTLRPLLGLEGEPSEGFVVRHKQVVPQYAVGHLVLKRALEDKLSEFKGLQLAGNGLHGVGLADCVARAQQSAELMGAELSDSKA